MDKPIINSWENPENGEKVSFTWISSSDEKDFHPVTQCYGVCFNGNGEILIQRKNAESGWALPGGTVEEGETFEQTLRREFIEEVDTEIKNIHLIGGQKVQFIKKIPENINPKADNTFQLRFYCEVDKILPQTPDPDDENIRERLFVPIDDIGNYFYWGTIGEDIFRRAKELYHKFNYHADKDKRVEGERHAGIVLKDGKILLMHRIKNGHEYWVIPGGHRQKDESGDSTVEREIFEETGIKTKCRKIILENNGEYYYLCSWVSGKKPFLNGEEKERNSKENFFEPLWVQMEKINELNILPAHIKEWLLLYQGK